MSPDAVPSSKSDLELIETSLEYVAECAGDFTPLVYAHFFARCPTARRLFAERMILVQGRMLSEILQSILDCAAGKNYLEGLIETQTGDHDAWGVARAMYAELFAALMQTLQDILAEEWTTDVRAAWQRQIDAIMRIVNTTNAVTCAHH